MELVKDYSLDYTECTQQAKEEKENNLRPELRQLPESIEKYDIIYLGYPNYWGTMPMPVFTFLDAFDFTGKIIKPFCTHEGSGLGTSEVDLKKYLPTAEIKKGIAIKGSDVNNAEKVLKDWI